MTEETEDYPKSGIELKPGEIKVPACALRIAMLFMAKKDTRIHLNGVNLTKVYLRKAGGIEKYVL